MDKRIQWYSGEFNFIWLMQYWNILFWNNFPSLKTEWQLVHPIAFSTVKSWKKSWNKEFLYPENKCSNCLVDLKPDTLELSVGTLSLFSKAKHQRSKYHEYVHCLELLWNYCTKYLKMAEIDVYSSRGETNKIDVAAWTHSHWSLQIISPCLLTLQVQGVAQLLLE